jgi:hypothetical protein
MGPGPTAGSGSRNGVITRAGVERLRLLFCVGRPPVAETRRLSRSLLPLVAKHVETRLPPRRQTCELSCAPAPLRFHPTLLT